MHRIEGENLLVEDGKAQFKKTPPYTVVTPEWLTAVQEEIAYCIEQAGFSLYSQVNDPRNQLWQAIQRIVQPYEYVVTSQEEFESLFSRRAANEYEIDPEIRSVLFKIRTGGYSVPSLLSGGDTWGDLFTKNCTHLEFENGAYITFGDNPGNLTAETNNGLLKNVDLRGTGSVAAAVTESFELNAQFVTFDNCKTSSRYSNTGFAGFRGSGTALHNTTSKYNNCSVSDMDGSSDMYAFLACYNLQNCIGYDIASTGGAVYTFSTCYNINNCRAQKIDTTITGAYGFHNCNDMNSCAVYDIDGTGCHAYGFAGCNQLNSCRAEDIDSTTSIVYGYYDCENLSSCIAYDIQSPEDVSVYAYRLCYQLSSCKAITIDATGTGSATGFMQCEQLSGCSAKDIDMEGGGGAPSSQGYINCKQLSACYAEDIDSTTGDSFGFANCMQLSACEATDIDSSSGTAEGFWQCRYGSSLYTDEASNSLNDWIDTVDASITNKVSTPSVWT